jgi:tetratricopeptide (TPR) repeat protein
LAVRLIFCVGWLWGLLSLASAAALAQDSPASAPPPPSPAEHAPNRLTTADLLDDGPEPFVPLRPRSAADIERLEAMSLFAAARIKEQHEDFAGALKLYQRALRHDPHSLPILDQIIPLAEELGRRAEAIRYAALALELAPSDANRLRELGNSFGRQGEYERALKCYDQARALHADKDTAGYILLTIDAGRCQFLTQQYALAADSFAEVMAALDDPDDFGIDDQVRRRLFGEGGPTRIYELFAETFLLADRPDRALEAFERANAAAPNAAVHAYHLASVHERRGQPREAYEQLQVYLDAHETEEDSAPYELFAKVLADLGREADLLPALEKALGGDPGNMPLRLYLAGRYLAAGKLELAEPLYTEAAADTTAPVVLQALASIHRQQRAFDKLLAVMGACAEVAQRILTERAIEGQRLKSLWLGVLGEEANKITGDPDVVSALFEAARRPRPENDSGPKYVEHLAAGLTALETNDWDAAAEFLSQAIKTQRGHADVVYQTWGLNLLLASENVRAEQVLRSAVDDPAAAGPELYQLLSAALEMSQKYDEALAAAKAAVGRAAGSDAGTRALLESNIPFILYRAKRYADAAAAYKAFIEAFDGNRHSEQVREQLQRARLVLSNICVTEHDLPQAEEWLEQVLDEYPENVSAQNDLGYLWADQGKHLDRALEMGRNAVEAEPDNAAYRDTLGWALYKLGRFDEAVVELQKAAEVEKPDGEILEHLGDALLSAGKLADARQIWQSAIERCEEQGEKERIEAIEKKLAANPEPENEGSE